MAQAYLGSIFRFLFDVFGLSTCIQKGLVLNPTPYGSPSISSWLLSSVFDFQGLHCLYNV